MVYGKIGEVESDFPKTEKKRIKYRVNLFFPDKNIEMK